MAVKTKNSIPLRRDRYDGGKTSLNRWVFTIQWYLYKKLYDLSTRGDVFQLNGATTAPKH